MPAVRGPGTVISPADHPSLQGRIQFYAQAFPCRDETGDLKLVGPDGKALDAGSPSGDCHVSEEKGVSRVDVAPLARALGFEAKYVVHDDGRRRIYLKKPEA